MSFSRGVWTDWTFAIAVTVIGAMAPQTALAQRSYEPRSLTPSQLAQPSSVMPHGAQTEPQRAKPNPIQQTQFSEPQPNVPAVPVPAEPAPQTTVQVSQDNQIGAGQQPATRKGSLPAMGTVVGSLSIVIGLFLIVAWLTRKSLPRSRGLLPREAIEVLGRAPLAGKQFVHLLRVGNKLLLVSISSTGTETLTEITDPLEVDRLVALCGGQAVPNAAPSFQQHYDRAAGAGVDWSVYRGAVGAGVGARRVNERHHD